MGVAQQLRDLRRSRHRTASVVAREVSSDASNIYAIESGRRDARLSTTERIASALGARLLLVDTGARASAAEAATAIHLLRDRPDAAAQVLTQLFADLRAVDPVAKAALTAEAAQSVSPEWDAAIAGVVELELSDANLGVPDWVSRVAGDPHGRWDPWTRGTLLPDPDSVPEPLRRRGVWIDPAELASV